MKKNFKKIKTLKFIGLILTLIIISALVYLCISLYNQNQDLKSYPFSKYYDQNNQENTDSTSSYETINKEMFLSFEENFYRKFPNLENSFYIKKGNPITDQDIDFDYDTFVKNNGNLMLSCKKAEETGSWPNHGLMTQCENSKLEILIASRLFKERILYEIVSEYRRTPKIDYNDKAYFLENDFYNYIYKSEENNITYCKYLYSFSDLGNSSYDIYISCYYDEEKKLNQQLDKFYKTIDSNLFGEKKDTWHLIPFKNFIPTDQELNQIISSKEFQKHSYGFE